LYVTRWSILGLGSIAAILLLFAHVEKRLDQVAILKSLGATSGYVVLSQFWQVALIGAGAAIPGLAVGRLIAPPLARAGLFEWGLPLKLIWGLQTGALCAAAAVVVPIGVAIFPVFRLVRVAPLCVLRRDLRRDGGRPRNASRLVLAIISAASAFIALPHLLRGPATVRAESSLPYASADFVVIGMRGEEALALTRKLRDRAVRAEVHALAKVRTGSQSAVASCADDLPAGQLRLSSQYAEALGLRAGQEIFLSGDRFVVQSVVVMDSVQNVRLGIQLPCTYLNRRFPAFYEVAVYGDERVMEFVHEQYPAAAVLRSSELRSALKFGVDRAVRAIEFVSLLVYLGGCAVLASLVLASRRRRLREIAIWRALGATRSMLLRRFAREFGVLGLIGGGIGAAVATFTAAAVQFAVLGQKGIPWDLRVVATVVLGSSIASGVAGMLAVWPLLQVKPLITLREE
jgi:predicted lysophospholipase L1 biosynthesis ABC-type transport system permease subunit